MYRLYKKNKYKSTKSAVYTLKMSDKREGNCLFTGFALKKIIEIALIITFAIITYLSIVINAKILFVLLGVLVFLFLLTKIITTPASILSLLFLINHPISLTLGQTGIPFLGASAVLLINLIAIGIWFSKNISARLCQKDIQSFVWLLLFGFLLIVKWMLSSFSHDGFQQVYNFWGFCIIPYMVLLYVLKRKEDYDLSISLAQKFFIAYLIAFLLLYLLKPDFHEIINEVDNPISLSFLFLSNGLIALFSDVYKNRLIKYVVLLLTLFMMIVIGQRSYLFACFLFLVLMFFKSNLNCKKKFLILLVSILGACVAISYLPEDMGYKFNYLISFIKDIDYYLSMIPTYGSELHEQIGTIGTRLYLWYEALTSANFWTGNSLGSFVSLTGYNYPHNIILEFYYSFGFFGCCIFLIYIVNVFKCVLSKQIIYSQIGYTSVILFVLFVVLQFSSSISGMFVFFILYYFVQRRYINIKKHENINYQ